MRINLAQAQRYACIGTAWVIVLFQLLSFAQSGIYGSDWVFSFIVAAVFGLLGTRRITGGAEPEKAVIESGAAKPAPAAMTPTKDDAPPEDTNASPVDEADDEEIMGRNGWVLSREVALRAQRIIALIPRPANPEPKTEDEIWANRAADLEYSRLRELAFMLCLGLVAIRKAGKNETYLSETEYQHMQYAVFGSLCEDVTMTFEQIGCPLDLDEMSQRLELDIDSIRGFIKVAISEATSGTPGRAKPLIEWVASKGLVVSEVSLIKNALMTVEEWNSDSPVHAYPA